MALKYALQPNNLIEDRKVYRAVIQDVTTYNQEDIIENMIRRGSTVTKSDALANVEEYYGSIEDLMTRGKVNTPFMRISHSISGNFENYVDYYQPGQHKVNIKMVPGPRLRKVAEMIEVQKIAAGHRTPKPHYYIDAKTLKEIITPGGGATIKGSNLKLDLSDPNQGIFFINTDDRKTTRVKGIMRNKPSELIFQNPDLAPGNYRLEVRSLLKNAPKISTGRVYESLRVL